MKVMTENFNKLLNSKLGDSKPLVDEQIKVGKP
jgi:ribonuclease HIII